MSLAEKINSPKYAQILATAKDLFMRFGVKRITIEEICSTANVSKMTFYKFFKNKNDLALNMITNLMDEGLDKFDEIIAGKLPFNEKMNLFVKMKMDYSNRMSMEFYSDFMNYSPEVHDFVVKRAHTNMQRMMALFNEAQQNGDIRSDLDLKFLTFMLNKMIEIAEDPQLAQLYPETKQLTRQWLDLFLYGIIGKKPAK